MEADPGEPIDGLIAIGSYASVMEAHERGLVVLSARSPYWLHDAGDRVDLLVTEGDGDRLASQVALYEEESTNWPPPEVAVPEEKGGTWAAMLWATTLSFAFMAQVKWSGLFDWGMLSSEKVQAGEIYRCLSALLLHSDMAHLVSNLVFGLVLIYLVARQTGNITAFLAVFLSGILGNLLNAWVHFGEQHYSVGASTAVFGCIGILVSLKTGFALRHESKGLVHAWGAPFITGMIMLAWFGTGNEFTDTTAHLFGFICGLPLGIGLGMRPFNNVTPGEARG